MNKTGKKLIVCLNILILLLFSAFGQTSAFAAEEGAEEAALVYVTGYEVSGKSVAPGSNFTLTLTLKNSSSTVSAEDVTVSITNPAGVVPEYGTVSTAHVGTLAAGATKKVSVKYTSNANVSDEELKFSVNVRCDGGVTSTEVRVPVGEKAQVYVTGYKASVQPVAPGDSFTLTVTLKNYSKDSAAENVIVTLNNPTGVAPQYGTVCVARVDSIKADSTADVTFRLTTDKNISASNLNFMVGVVSDTSSASTQISVPVAETPEVGITGYEVTKNPIVPGDEFTVTLSVKNYSKSAMAKNISVTLSNPSGVIPEYGKVNTARVDKIAPNATVKVDFTFTATSDLVANELYFTATVTGDSISSGMQFSIPIRKLAQLYVEGYEVTNETIVPGNDFALKVRVKNLSTEVTVKDAVVIMSNPTGVIPEYGKVGTAYIESLAPGSTEELCFRYSSTSDIKTSELNFTVGVFYDNLSTSAQIRIPVGKMTDFSVEKASMPEQLVVGKVGYASAMIENLEETGVSNVTMVARCNGKDIASANIGTISAKTYKTQSVSLLFDTEGQYAVDLVVTYTNGEGENKEYTISSSIVKVVAEEKVADNNEVENVVPADTQETPSEQGISNILLFSISGVLLIGLCCVILILLYRRKK
ncbi:MAG: NEW3 domain-containing protein [Lachnospiraceae bacterium]|nr:NEW3 domain-containing protein [Lachnospiraceae bacterium]